VSNVLELQLAIESGHYGICPRCARPGYWIDIGPPHDFFYCRQHSLYWAVLGVPCGLVWKCLGAIDRYLWEENAEIIADMERIPVFYSLDLLLREDGKIAIHPGQISRLL
jgi:hypothetical protein